MAFGRWYPTLTALPDGHVLTMAGKNENKVVVTTPELWNGTNWSQLWRGLAGHPVLSPELRGSQKAGAALLRRRTDHVPLV